MTAKGVGRSVVAKGSIALGLAGALLAFMMITGSAWGRSLVHADPVLVGAGDIGDCNSPGAAVTAELVEGIPGTVFTLGDNAYPRGSAKDLANCYDPTWGEFKDRTRPAAGNHDYLSNGAQDYYEYFGPAAGDPGRGYYSYDLGAWHIIVLNSNCNEVGGCGKGSEQEQWLRADLEAHPGLCTLAYWHHPMFGSSGQHTKNTMMQAIWWDLYRAGVDVVLNGHAHNYERLAPLDPKGVLDVRRGIRQFIVGTGGRDLRQFSKPIMEASEARDGETYGVLKLTLHEGSYDWQFVPEPGKPFTDSGTEVCHQ